MIDGVTGTGAEESNDISGSGDSTIVDVVLESSTSTCLNFGEDDATYYEKQASAVSSKNAKEEELKMGFDVEAAKDVVC